MEKRFNNEEELISYLKDGELFGLDSEFSGLSDRLVEKLVVSQTSHLP